MIKEFWPSKSKANSIHKIYDEIEDSNKAECLNEFFATVGYNLAEQIPNTEPMYNNPKAYPPVFYFHEITAFELVIFIRDMKSSNSCGTDGLTMKLVKLAGPSIVEPLLHIINRSITSGIFPNIWKVGCITPLYKDGDATNPANYRPISILPCLGKLLERIIHTQLYAYLTKSGIITHEQSGFRKGHSTGTCLIDFLENIYLNIDRNLYCGVLFLDLKKAFDTVIIIIIIITLI